MKVKPFYIKTSNLTEMQIASAIDKCVKHGAEPAEGVAGFHSRSNYHCGLFSPSIWVYFGVDDENQTTIEDAEHYYGDDAIEITLDQLDAHLGVDVEWNGEGLPPVGCVVLGSFHYDKETAK